MSLMDMYCLRKVMGTFCLFFIPLLASSPFFVPWIAQMSQVSSHSFHRHYDISIQVRIFAFAFFRVLTSFLRRLIGDYGALISGLEFIRLVWRPCYHCPLRSVCLWIRAVFIVFFWHLSVFWFLHVVSWFLGLFASLALRVQINLQGCWLFSSRHSSSELSTRCGTASAWLWHSTVIFQAAFQFSTRLWWPHLFC